MSSSPEKRPYHKTKPRSKESSPRKTLLRKKFFEENPEATEDDLKVYRILYKNKVSTICAYAKRNQFEAYSKSIISKIPYSIEGIKEFKVAQEYKNEVGY